MAGEVEERAPARKKRRKREASPARGDEGTTGAPAAPAAAPGSSVQAPPHRWVLGAAVAAATGVALVGTGPSEPGTWLAVVGGVGLIAAIHRLGRLGPA